MKKRIICLSTLALLSVATASHAISFTDEAAWRDAVDNVFALENFDGIATGTDISELTDLGIVFDPLDDGTQPTVQAYLRTGGRRRSGPNNLLNDRDFSLPARGPYSLRTIDPTDLLFGVGLWNVGGDDRLRMTFLDSEDNIIEEVISANGSGFFGIVNPLGAARVAIDFVGGNGYAPIDNLQTAVRSTFDPDPGRTPEPASIVALLGVSLASMAISRRKKTV